MIFWIFTGFDLFYELSSRHIGARPIVMEFQVSSRRAFLRHRNSLPRHIKHLWSMEKKYYEVSRNFGKLKITLLNPVFSPSFGRKSDCGLIAANSQIWTFRIGTGENLTRPFSAT
jgi:hypothetical protein